MSKESYRAFATLLERENFSLFKEIVKIKDEGEQFSRLQEVITEKDVRIFNKMSRRRKKIFFQSLNVYELSTGKFTTRKRLGQPGFERRPGWFVINELIYPTVIIS